MKRTLIELLGDEKKRNLNRKPATEQGEHGTYKELPAAFLAAEAVPNGLKMRLRVTVLKRIQLYGLKMRMKNLKLACLNAYCIPFPK